MGILSGGNYPEQGEASMKESRECKPDYEAMIKRAKEKASKSRVFRQAIFDFLEGRRVPDALVTIVGELDFEIISVDRSVDEMIQRQENDK